MTDACGAAIDVGGSTVEDLVVAVRHLEDLEVFVGQRSRLHPGPGWALVLQMLRQDLAELRRLLDARLPTTLEGC